MVFPFKVFFLCQSNTSWIYLRKCNEQEKMSDCTGTPLAHQERQYKNVLYARERKEQILKIKRLKNGARYANNNNNINSNHH